ncbi:MAG: rhamnogalacturonan acetylesterase [Marinilabiliaceae bacterium]|nr:rhamnogalacturonan acetylesterase [Marinilabiliaceae bacterium]
MKINLLTVVSLFTMLSCVTAQESKNAKLEAIEDVNKVTDLTLDSLDKVRQARIEPGTSRKEGRPVLFLIGNSTMRNGTLGNGNNGQWGWGYYAEDYFDKEKISVENQALGGTSSRTFYRRLWPDIRKAIMPGDWVIISIGHNDNGPFDSGRARASIKGIGTDSLEVTIKETGVHEVVYSYGEYLRRYIRETRERGGNPVLMSLTPRHAREADGKNQRKTETFTLWAKQVAEQMNVPFIDQEKISAEKLDKFTQWKYDYHFFIDNIHTSRFGAELNARSAAEGIAAYDKSGLEYLQSCLVSGAICPKVNIARKKGRPMVFITGDSTVKNEDKNPDGMWGWGSQAATVFDTTKITPVNWAKAGRSCRTYLNEGRWDQVYNSIEPGDFVLIQFGHNDIGGIDKDKERGEIACTSDTCHVYKSAKTGKYEVVYSFGWYLRKFIDDVREKGGTPILVSLTPRNEWPNGKIERRNDSYGKWYREVVEQTGVEFVDLHNISADALDKIGQKKAAAYYNHDHTHTSLKGAKLNAKNIGVGLREIKSDLAKYLKK